MSTAAAAGSGRFVKLELLADVFAAAVAFALPWSTSATLVFAALWVLALAPTITWTTLRAALVTPVGALPVAMVVLAALGMLWAGVSWQERLHGFGPFLRLLAIPLLLVQFARSANGLWLLTALMISTTALLIASWLLVLFPSLPWTGRDHGVPVRDYISQSGFFTLCMFVLLHIAADAWDERRSRDCLLMIAGAAAFAANIAFVATSRTTLVVIAVLLPLFVLRRYGGRVATAMIAGAAIVVAIVWASSPYLRMRAMAVPQEIARHQAGEATPSGARLEFWSRSLAFLRAAPAIGTGTGSIRETFRRNAPDPANETATNPHNQVFAVGIQLGLIGIAVLVVMWAAHWWFFLVPGLAGWFGLMIVTQNVAGSLFNSHLMDFTQGWLYVLGVGIAGGAVLRAATADHAP